MGWFSKARLAVAAGAGALALAASGQAAADPLPAGGMTLQEVDAWLQSNGFSTTDDAEHHEVLTKLGTAKIAVFLTDCDSQRCQSLQFFDGLSYPNGVRPDDGSAAVLVNGWNRHFRWTKAWVNELRYPVLEMDVSLSPGVDKDALNHSLITYVQSITLFNYYLNANKGS